MEHLAPASSVNQSLNAYIAWARPTMGGDFRNLGQLVLYPDRSATLVSTVPWRDVEVVVTTEENPRVMKPSEFVVLRGNASPR